MRERTTFEREAGSEPAVLTPRAPVGRPPAVGKITWSMRVVDEQGHPVDGEEYAAHQEKTGARGVVSAGRADMGRIDPLKPFRFEVPRRACAIKEGAVLLTDDKSVEYGGVAVDWSEADGATADQRFWPDYAAYRTAAMDGPSGFWQHEHLTRRPIRLRQAWAQPGSGKTAVIIAAPVRLRVGPLVRYTSADTAVIWLETHTPAMVRVRFDKRANKRASPVDRFGATVRVGGRHYALVVLDGLSETTRYDYTVEVAPLPAAGGVPIDQAAARTSFPTLSAGVLGAIKDQLRRSSFDGTEWLTFRTLRTRYDRGLRFAYGSCRKWPFDRAGTETSGPDALEAFQSFMAKRHPDREWPRFLLLVGDQIYADDIGHHQGVAIARQRWGRRIPGPKPSDGQGAWAGRFSDRFTGVTTAPRHQRYRIDNHLLWEIPIDASGLSGEALKATPAGDTRAPAHPEIPPVGKSIPIHAADFAEYAYLYEAAWARRDPIRKILANLPLFMVMDDHEITDDWNFDRQWLELVHRPPGVAINYWPDTIADALAAFWLYQSWGNLSPRDWAKDPRVALLLTHRAAGTDALAPLRQLLRRDFEPPAKSLTWDYPLPIESPIFYAVDCRMRRILRSSKGPSFDDQVLDPAGVDKMRQLFVRSSAPVAFMISSLPILLPGLIGDSFRLDKVTASFLGIPAASITPLRVDEAFRRKRDMEHWVANRSWFDVLKLLSDLSKEAPNLKAVVALSGDTHFSFNMLSRLDPAAKIPKQMKLKPTRTDAAGRGLPYLLQMVSSGMKQQIPDRNAYRVRLLVEDDAVLKGAKFTDEDTKKLEKLRRGTAIANGLYRPELTRSEYDFYGMRLRLGGFDGIDNPRRTLLMENSVAVVDLVMDPRRPEFKLVERYVTSRSTPSFTFETISSGATHTVPRFP